MLPFVLAAVLSLTTTGQTDEAGACKRLACTEECWEVRVTYRQIVSPPGAAVAYVTGQQLHGGAWGDMAGARCHADAISHGGFWLDGDEVKVPTLGPTKIPAGAVELLQVLEREF